MTGKITAPLASLIIASVLSGTAAADDLAQIRAISCGTDPAKASSVAMPTGSLFKRGHLQALAKNKDGDFPARSACYQRLFHAATAVSTARLSLSITSSICASSMINGGASMTWSPCLPSIVPLIG